jgi:hypothetical protein
MAPPLAALLYPFALKGFNASVTRIAEGASTLSWLSAAVCLALAFAMPLIAMLAAMSLSEIGRPTAAQLRAKRAALLAVAVPTLFNRDRRDVRGGRAAERESERDDRNEAAKPRGRIVHHPGRRATQVAGRGAQDHRRKRRHARGHADSGQHKARSARTTPSTTTP